MYGCLVWEDLLFCQTQKLLNPEQYCQTCELFCGSEKSLHACPRLHFEWRREWRHAWEYKPGSCSRFELVQASRLDVREVPGHLDR